MLKKMNRPLTTSRPVAVDGTEVERTWSVTVEGVTIRLSVVTPTKSGRYEVRWQGTTRRLRHALSEGSIDDDALIIYLTNVENLRVHNGSVRLSSDVHQPTGVVLPIEFANELRTLL